MHPSNSKGEVMPKSIFAVLLTIVWFGLMAHVAEIPASAEQKITPQIQNPLLDIGHIGPDPVSFDVWTDKSPEVTYKEGEQVVIHFRSGRQCFLVVAAVTLSGDVWVGILEPLRASLVEGGVIAEAASQALIEGLSRWMTGAFAASLYVQFLLALLLGRWWQAVLYNPGGFGAEFRGLRLSPCSATPPWPWSGCGCGSRRRSGAMSCWC